MVKAQVIISEHPEHPVGVAVAAYAVPIRLDAALRGGGLSVEKVLTELSPAALA